MKIMVVDSDAYALTSARALLKQTFRDVRLATLTNTIEALNGVADWPPDIVIFDIDRSDCAPRAFLREMRKRCPNAKIIGLLREIRGYTLREFAVDAPDFFLIKGFQGYGDLVHSIRQFRDRQRLQIDVFKYVASRVAPHETGWELKLTKRELELLGEMGAGKTDSGIATEYGLSPNTVKNHRVSIKWKLSLTTDVQLVTFCLAHGFCRERIDHQLVTSTSTKPVVAPVTRKLVPPLLPKKPRRELAGGLQKRAGANVRAHNGSRL